MNLKKWILAVAVAFAPAVAMADTYAVWPAAGEGQTQIPVEFNHWYNFGTEVVEVDGISATKCYSANGTADASSGWLCLGSTNFDFKQLAPRDLVFDVKIEGPGEWHVRLTTPDQDAVISVPDDGKFHTVRLNIQKDFGNVYTTWNSGEANGQNIFPFAVVGTKLDAKSAFYFTNCRYEDAIPQPTLTTEVTEVTAETAKFSYSATFPEGYSNTSVTINGESAEPVGVKSLTGLTPRTDYSYVIVASGDYNGVTYKVEKTVTFTTSSKTGVEYVYNDVIVAKFNAYLVGETEADRRIIKAALPWSVTYRADETAVYSIDLSSVENIVGLVPKIWEQTKGGVVNLGKNAETGRWEYTFDDPKPTIDATAAISHYLEYAGGVFDSRTPYTKWGMEKKAGIDLYVRASAQNVTANSAEIYYEVTGSVTDYDVYYRLPDGSIQSAKSSPIKLEGLTPNTSYTYDVFAQKVYDRGVFVPVEFTTNRPDDSKTPVWHGTTELPGFYAEYSITYQTNSKLYVEARFETEKATPAGDRNFHITAPNEEWLKLIDDGTGLHKGTTTNSFIEGQTVNWEWHLPYDGGAYKETNQYVVGSENEAPLALRVKASVENLKAETAEIKYEVVCPVSDYKVYYKVAGGEAVEATASPIALTGLTPEKEYTYELYVTANIDGSEVTSKVVTVKFTTLSLDARDRVFNDIVEAEFNAYLVGETEADRRIIKASLPWSVTYRADGIAVYSIDLSSVENIVGLNPQIWEQTKGVVRLTKNAETGRWEFTFDDPKPTLSATAAISHYLAYDGGVFDSRTPYTEWGMEKEAPISLFVSASAQNVTATGAEIKYEVTGTVTGYEVYYKLGEAEPVKATTNPIKLEGLTERTSYSYEVYAEATVDGEPVKSESAVVTFKTPALNAVDLVYSDIVNAEFTNAYLVGEQETSRRTIYASLPWSVTYRADETAVYSIDLSSVENVVGLAPQIYWNGFQTLTKNAETGRWEFEFGKQTAEAEVAISHFIAYNGGNFDSRTPYTKWGMEKEAPVLGEPVSLDLSASAEYVKLGQPVILTCVAKDAAGYYLPAEGVTLTCASPDAVIEGSTATLNKNKGDYHFKAVMGKLEDKVIVYAIASPEASNLVSGLKGVTDEENIQGGTVENVTDNDRNSQLEWKCTETEKHYLVYDLAKEGAEDGYYIEAVEVYFEGAFAKSFTVTLSSQAPDEIATAADMNTRAAATSDVVFTNTTEGVEHMFTRDPKEQHRYVTLRTNTALNTGWGIKVRDIKVYGTLTTPSSVTTGVESIAVDTDENAPVEYYNLNGVRVENPAAGLYIRRQGSNVTKVYIK